MSVVLGDFSLFPLRHFVLYSLSLSLYNRMPYCSATVLTYSLTTEVSSYPGQDFFNAFLSQSRRMSVYHF